MSWKKSQALSFQRPNDTRLGQQISSLEKAEFVLQGYPDDEGVEHNGGRKGAAGGPDGIRSFLAKLTVSDKTLIYDHGNLSIQEEDIRERHEKVIASSKDFYAKGKKIISLGGGHDYGYPDTKAFYDTFQDEKPLVINFDAHLDVREVEEKISSGTPFYRLLSECPKVDFVELGLLKVCNNPKHLEWLHQRGGKSVFYEDLIAEQISLCDKFTQIYGDSLIQERSVFLSIDIDCFSSAFAPGCSQSWPFAMQPADFFPLMSLLMNRWKVRGIGIYEVAPNLDESFKTQRLAAQIIHKYLEG